MTVVATCFECDDEHRVGDRVRDESANGTCTTTRCPACNALGYRSRSTTATVKSADERIADAIGDCAGVGQMTLENVQATFDTYTGLEQATQSELTAIEGVGTATAERIADVVS